MAMMFEPIRGGNRGGQADFKWADVSADKDREHYLGHSINAPTGRWQKNKDVHWYNRDQTSDEQARLEEIKKVKEAEKDALSIALGFEPEKRDKVDGEELSSEAPNPANAEGAKLAREREKEEKRRRKADRRERKEEKRARKAAKDQRRHGRDERWRSNSPPPRRHRRSSSPPTRYRSPLRRREQQSRSRSPPPRRREDSRDYGQGKPQRTISPRRYRTTGAVDDLQHRPGRRRSPSRSLSRSPSPQRKRGRDFRHRSRSPPREPRAHRVSQAAEYHQDD